MARKKRKPTGAAVPKFTPDQIAGALTEQGGNVSATATALRCDRGTVYNYIKRYKTVRDALEDGREYMTDIAEHQLARHIRQGNLTAIIFYLKTQGKRRGYIEGGEPPQLSVEEDWWKAVDE